MKTIQVEHIVSSLEMPSSGVTVGVLGICGGLVNNGVDLRVHSLVGAFEPMPAGIHGKVRFDYKSGIESYVYPCSRIPFRKFGRSPHLYKAIAEAARTSNIIHNHNLWMAPNVYPYYAIRFNKRADGSRCKLVTSPHGTLTEFALRVSRWKKKIMWAIGQGQMMRSTDMFHATCEDEYNDIRRLGFRQPVILASLGINIPSSQTINDRGQSRRQLLYLSRIHTDKRLDLLLEAWKRLEQEHPNWDLLIYGPLDGEYPPKMVAYARNLGLERAYFKGGVFGEAKDRVYGAADLFVLPTHTENFGLAIAEALSCGTPVITTKGAPWRELETYGCGWWVDESASALYDSLHVAMSKPRSELDDMGRRGRDWMIRDFAWDNIGRKIADSYEWLCYGGKVPNCVIVD